MDLNKNYLELDLHENLNKNYNNKDIIVTKKDKKNIKKEIKENRYQEDLNPQARKEREDNKYKNYLDYTKDLKSEKFNFYYKV
jgi:hypothetical protein